MGNVSASKIPSSTPGKEGKEVNFTLPCAVGRMKSSDLMTHLAPLCKVRHCFVIKGGYKEKS